MKDLTNFFFIAQIPITITYICNEMKWNEMKIKTNKNFSFFLDK